MAEKINTGPKSIGEASKLALAEMLLAAAKNPKSEITMDDYNNYMKTGKLNFASGGIASMDDMTKPLGYENGGPVELSKNISDENLSMIETVLTDIYKKKGGPLDDSQVIRLALDLAKARSIGIGDKEVDVNFGGTSEDNINLLIDGINMMQGSAIERAKATDGNLTAREAADSTKNFIKRGINKLGRMFN
jgi:hypothetical protein